MILHNPSRAELIKWVNDVAGSAVKTLEELSDGFVLCQLINRLFENPINIKRLNPHCQSPLDKQKNLKILSRAMFDEKLMMNIDIIGISQKRILPILETVQYIFRNRNVKKESNERRMVNYLNDSLVSRAKSKTSINSSNVRSKSHDPTNKSQNIKNKAVVMANADSKGKDDNNVTVSLQEKDKKKLENTVKSIFKNEDPQSYIPIHVKFDHNGDPILTAQDQRKMPNLTDPSVKDWRKKLIRVVDFVVDKFPEIKEQINDLLESDSKNEKKNEPLKTTQKEKNQFETVYHKSQFKSMNTSLICQKDSHLKELNDSHNQVDSEKKENIIRYPNLELNPQKIEEKQPNLSLKMKEVPNQKISLCNPENTDVANIKKQGPIKYNTADNRSKKMWEPLNTSDALKHFFSDSKKQAQPTVSNIFGEHHFGVKLNPSKDKNNEKDLQSID